MAQSRSSRSGITLVEAMVAIAILAIVATLVWGGFSQTAKNKRRVERKLDRIHVIRAALGRMTRELSMAYTSTHVNPDQSMRTTRTAFVGSEDRVDFTSFSHQRLVRDANESDQNELGYFAATHPDDSSKEVLARREQDRIDEDPLKGGDVQIFVEHIEEIRFEYYDPLSGEWTSTWDTTQSAMQPNRLPKQVKILLTVPALNEEDEEETFATRTQLPLTWALNHANYNP